MRSKSKIPKGAGLLGLDSALQLNDGVRSRCGFKELRPDGANFMVFPTSEKNANEDTRHRAASAET